MKQQQRGTLDGNLSIGSKNVCHPCAARHYTNCVSYHWLLIAGTEPKLLWRHILLCEESFLYNNWLSYTQPTVSYWKDIFVAEVSETDWLAHWPARFPRAARCGATYGEFIFRCVSALSHTDVRFITVLSSHPLYRCAKREGTNFLLMFQN